VGTHMVEKVVKNSIIYGYAFSQPFAAYMDMFPMVQNQLLMEAEVKQFGETGELVQHLQHTLNNLGYYDDEIDGVFGLLTEHALKKYQSTKNISVTGQADEETMRELIKDEKTEMIKNIESLIQSIQYGENSDEVKEVQEVLHYFGYYKGEIDGIYGSLTEDAISQVKHENLISINEEPEITVNENITNNNEQEETITVKETVQLDVGKVNGSIIQSAKSFMGTPYVWGGSSPSSGFDCSGFIQYLYGQENKVIPRTVSEIWNFASPTSSPSVGDLVFFETYTAGPSHLGIYLGNNEFIHAGVSNGVSIGNLTDNYWKTRYLGSKVIK